MAEALIDRYLLGEPVSKPDVVASLLASRTTAPAAEAFYRAFEAIGARAADEAFVALRLVLAGRLRVMMPCVAYERSGAWHALALLPTARDYARCSNEIARFWEICPKAGNRFSQLWAPPLGLRTRVNLRASH